MPPPASSLPRSFAKDTREIKADVSIAVDKWLESHGKHVKVKISDAQRAEASAAFKLMDTDGSGKLSFRELQAAFNLLGLGLDTKELRTLMNDVDTDKSGLLEVDEFLALMTESLTKKLEEDMPTYTLPFPLLSSQYRRKRYLEGIISGDNSTLQELVLISDRQQHEQLRLQENPKKIELEAAAKVIQDELEPSEDQKEREERELQKKAQSRTAHGKAVLRLSQMNKLDEGLISTLSKEQLSLLIRASGKQLPRSEVLSPSVVQSPRPMSGIPSPAPTRPRSKPCTPRDLLAPPPGYVPPLTLNGLSQLSPRPNTSRSKLSTPRDEQLLDMPQGNLSLVFTRSVIGSRPTSGISNRNNAEWLQAKSQQSTPRVERVKGYSVQSPRPNTSTDKEAQAIHAASHAASLIGSMTPRSARQKGLDYALMMEKERSSYGVNQGTGLHSPRLNQSSSFSSRPSPRHSPSSPQPGLISSGALNAMVVGSMGKQSMESPRSSPRPSSAILPSSPNSPKPVPHIPMLQLSKVSLSERIRSPRQ